MSQRPHVVPAKAGNHGENALFLCAGVLSFFVFIEPAPVDLLLMGWLLVRLVRLDLQWRRELAAALFLAALFLASNLAPFLYPGLHDALRGLFYLLISAYLCAAFVLIAAGFQRHPAAFGWFMSGCAIGALASTAFGLLGMLGIVPVPAELQKVAGRLQGFFKDPNVFGPALVPVLLYALHRLQEGAGLGRFLFHALVLLACAAGILLSFSRAAWLNAVLALGLYALWKLRRPAGAKRHLLLTSLGALAMLCVVALFAFVWEDTSALFAARLELQAYDEDRFSVQRQAMLAFFDFPLGVGPGQSEVLFNYAAHSLYARVLVENGLVGALAVAALLAIGALKALAAAFRRGADAGAIIVAATLAGLLANSFFVDTLHWRHLWIFLAFAYGVRPHENPVPHHQGGSGWRAVARA